jgi:hypothetical protein
MPSARGSSSAASVNASTLATTPDRSSVVAMSVTESPSTTSTRTAPVPSPE